MGTTPNWLLLSLLMAVGVGGCEKRSSAPEPDGGLTTAPAPDSGGVPNAPPSWRAPTEGAKLVVRAHDGTVRLTRGAFSVDLRPVLRTAWSETFDGPVSRVETALEVTEFSPGPNGGFRLHLTARDDLGQWQVRASAGEGDPRIEYVLTGELSRDLILHGQSVAFRLPTDSSVQALDRDYRFAAVETSFAGPALTPQWLKVGDDLAVMGTSGLDGYQVRKTEAGWDLMLQTYSRAAHPFRPRKECGDERFDRSAARLRKGDEIGSGWQFVVGTIDPVLPARFSRGKAAGVAIVVADSNPTMDRTKLFDIGDPSNDADGALELGVRHTKALPGGAEGIVRLGSYTKTAKAYGVEFAPLGADGSTMFRERFGARTWIDARTDECEAVYDEGWKDGTLQERVDAGFRHFWDGTFGEGLDLLEGNAAPIYRYPHALRRGTVPPLFFTATDATDVEKLTELTDQELLQKHAEARGLGIIWTTPQTWLTESAWRPDAHRTAQVLSRFGNERNLAVGTVDEIVGHAAAMSEVEVDVLPDGWVRARNGSTRDLKGASFLLPEGSKAVFPDGTDGEVKSGSVVLDLPPRGEAVFQITGAPWPLPVHYEIEEP